MKDIPLIMHADSVLATLAGRKCETSRVIKGAPATAESARWVNHWEEREGQTLAAFRLSSSSETAVIETVKLCYGNGGDQLWVREAWRAVPTSAYRCSENIQQTINPNDPDESVIYRAGWDLSDPGMWRSPIFMPRWASRLLLEVVRIKVRRLQDITEEGAIAEGMLFIRPPELPFGATYRQKFAAYWDTINPGRATCWDANPWVASIEYRRVA